MRDIYYPIITVYLYDENGTLLASGSTEGPYQGSASKSVSANIKGHAVTINGSGVWNGSASISATVGGKNLSIRNNTLETIVYAAGTYYLTV